MFLFSLPFRGDGRRGAMATRWQSYLCPVLLSPALQHLPAATLSCLQFAMNPRVCTAGELQKRAVLVFSAHLGMSPVPKPPQALPVTQVPVRAVAGVAGGREGAGSPVQAGLGLAGTVPKLTVLTREQPGADAGVTWRG